MRFVMNEYVCQRGDDTDHKIVGEKQLFRREIEFL